MQPETGILEELSLDPQQPMSRDLRQSADTLGPAEARFHVDSYYQRQEERTRSASQLRSVGDGEPHRILEWLTKNATRVEKQIKAVLGRYALTTEVGRWSMGVFGIGEVISAGLLAHIDITRAPTAGNIHSFAGLTVGAKWVGKPAAGMVRLATDGDRNATTTQILKLAVAVGCEPTWLVRRALRFEERAAPPTGGIGLDPALYIDTVTENDGPLLAKSLTTALTRRPWNADLKTLAWKIGESFLKFKGSDKCFYGQLFERFWAKIKLDNVAGKYKEAAAEGMARVGKKTEAYGHYSEGRLSPGHVLARAKRATVKLFLCHWHHVAFVAEYGTEPPEPYPMAANLLGDGHAHYIAPPNFP